MTKLAIQCWMLGNTEEHEIYRAERNNKIKKQEVFEEQGAVKNREGRNYLSAGRSKKREARNLCSKKNVASSDPSGPS